MTVLRDSDILALIQSNQGRIERLESSMQQHDHSTSFTVEGGGGKKLPYEGLSKSLQDEVDANLTHRTAQGNIHNVFGSQIRVGSGDYADYKISEAIQTIKDILTNETNRLEQDTTRGDNLTRTGDILTPWTADEAAIKNNRALYDLFTTHNHDERYIEPLELEAEITRHFQSGEHDHRYYRKPEIDAFLDAKSDAGHLHDDRYFTREQAAAAFVDAAGDVMSGDLVINKALPKLVLDDENTDGEAFSLVSTHGRLELRIKDAPWVSIDGDVDLTSGGMLKVNGVPVSLDGHQHQDIYYNNTEIADLLSTKSSVNHIHDARYYTKDELNDLLAEKTDVGHNHHDIYYPKDVADQRFLLRTGGDITELTVTNKLISQGRIDASEAGLYFPAYFAGVSINKDHDDIWGLVLHSGNLEQVFVQANRLRLRRDLVVGGDIHLSGRINGVNVQNLWASYQDHIAKADAHHPRYTDHEARQAINEDANHYYAANHEHNHDTIYYRKDHLDYLLQAKSDIDHDHDTVYMPRTELNEILGNKSDKDHDHTETMYTKQEIDAKVSLITDTLSQKADALHNHDSRYYTKTELDERLGSSYGTITKVLSGEMLVDSQGRATLPVPDGFARHECHYMASIADDTTVPYSTAGIQINRMTGEVQVQPNSVKSINYLVIGVR
jgi:hypothetical protein